MNFDESVSYLLNLGNEVLAMKLGLENIGKVLAALGNPEKKYLKVQIAGTNGKGSTVAFLEAICVASGIKIGSTTSPHLVSITERVKIGGAEIAENDFARHATTIREVSEKLVEKGELETVPTFFEQVTAIALNVFAEAEIELAILETGLGGRFDATTAARAEIVAITPIDYDHQNILGETLTQIAAEKAAVIRENTIAVISEQNSEAMQVLTDRCRDVNVPPIVNNCQSFAENFSEITFKTKRNVYPHVRLSLNGEHQQQNACTAINLAEVLTENYNFQIFAADIISGLENAIHKGRLEWRNVGGVQILFDGAHNVAGAKALAAYLQSQFADSRISMIFGTMRDKDIRETAEILFPRAENLILTEPDNPRSARIEDLRKIAENFVIKEKIFALPNVADAINAGQQIAATESATKHSFVCVTGSLYLVGEAQEILADSF